MRSCLAAAPLGHRHLDDRVVMASIGGDDESTLGVEWDEPRKRSVAGSCRAATAASLIASGSSWIRGRRARASERTEAWSQLVGPLVARRPLTPRAMTKGISTISGIQLPRLRVLMMTFSSPRQKSSTPRIDTNHEAVLDLMTGTR